MQAHVKVINIGSATRNFTFIATPFSGPGNPKATIQISPASASLVPHASVDVIASFTVTSDFQPGGQYNAELQIYGAYEQCVRIKLDVEPATGKDCTPEHCEVKAGDLPVRIRAHQWYDHFQCTEPCVPQHVAPRARRTARRSACPLGAKEGEDDRRALEPDKARGDHACLHTARSPDERSDIRESRTQTQPRISLRSSGLQV